MVPVIFDIDKISGPKANKPLTNVLPIKKKHK